MGTLLFFSSQHFVHVEWDWSGTVGLEFYYDFRIRIKTLSAMVGFHRINWAKWDKSRTGVWD